MVRPEEQGDTKANFCESFVSGLTSRKMQSPIPQRSKQTIDKTETRLCKKLPATNNSSKPITPLVKIYKWLLNFSVSPEKNISKIFEADYEVRPNNVSVNDDVAFGLSGQHLERQLAKGLKNARCNFTAAMLEA